MASVDVEDPGEMEHEPTSREDSSDDEMQVIFDTGEGIQFPGHDYNVMWDPVILTHLFDVHNLSELSHLRLVCKRWYELLLPRWRREVIPVVHNLDPPGSAPLNKLNWDNISQLWEDEEGRSDNILKLSSKPYHSFHLMKAQFNRSSLESKQFWKTVGSSIRHVEIEIVDVFSVKSFLNTIFEGMPLLESLSLSKVHFWNGHGWRGDEFGVVGQDLPPPPNKNLKCFKLLDGCKNRIESQWPWLPFLEHFPNLESLQLGGVSQASRIVSSLVDALEKLGGKEEQMCITSLNICEHVRNQTLTPENPNPAGLKGLLKRKEVQLKSLHFEMTLLEDSFGNVLRSVVQLHGDTLSKLHLHNSADSNRTKPYKDFPWGHGLHSLAEIHLNGPRPIMRNLHFLQHTPNLRVLHICCRQDLGLKILSLRKAPPLETPALAHLNSLRIEGGGRDFLLSLDQVERLARLMPNLKRLKCPLSDEAVRVVCEKWRGLRMLETWNEKLIDSAVTGLGRGLHGNEESCPNLTDLKDLRELSLGKVNNLTDLSVYTGFLKMDQLRVLKITVSRKISVAAFKALTRRFPGTEVKREESGNFGRAKEIVPDMVRRMMEFGPMPVGRGGRQLDEEEYIDVQIIPV